MLNLTTALGRNGFQDWIIQRVSALIIGLYAIFLLLFWLIFGASYIAWQSLFSIGLMRYVSILVLLLTVVHAWIGLWIVCTDYLKFTALKVSALIFIYCFLLFDLIWGIQILWGY